MADFFQILINLFCPTQSAMQQCTRFVMDHQANFGQMEALFYFVLFPIIFMLIFVFILVEFVMKKIGLEKHEKTISLLLAISFSIFVIISGWYPIFLYLSEIWYIVIILLVGLWVFLSKFLGGGGNDGGGGKGKALRGGGMASVITSPLATKKNYTKLTKTLDSLMVKRDNLKKQMKKPSEGTDTSNVMEQIRTVEAEAWKCIDELEDMVSVGTINLIPIAEKYKKKLND